MSFGDLKETKIFSQTLLALMSRNMTLELSALRALRKGELEDCCQRKRCFEGKKLESNG